MRSSTRHEVQQMIDKSVQAAAPRLADYYRPFPKKDLTEIMGYHRNIVRELAANTALFTSPRVDPMWVSVHDGDGKIIRAGLASSFTLTEGPCNCVPDSRYPGTKGQKFDVQFVDDTVAYSFSTLQGWHMEIRVEVR